MNGLSLAYHLAAEHGIRDVAVIERSYIGSGGSGRNTQVLRANYNTPETVPLYAASLAKYRRLSQELEFNVLVHEPGRARPLPHGGFAAGRAREVRVEPGARRADRHPRTRRDPRRCARSWTSAVAASCPCWVRRITQPVRSRDTTPSSGGTRRPPLAEASHVHQGMEVTGMRIEGGRCVGVETSQGSVGAGHVVSAVAGWSSQVAAMAGVRLPIVTHTPPGVRHRALSTRAAWAGLLDGSHDLHVADRARRAAGGRRDRSRTAPTRHGRPSSSSPRPPSDR